MTIEGRTVYGFIRGAKPLRFGAIGIEGREVYTLSAEGIAALVSRLPFVDFETIPKETLLQNLTVYQAVIENVMGEHPVIPVKFGSFLADDEAVVQMLKQEEDRIEQSQKEMEDRIELDVVVLWPDLNRELVEIGNTEEIDALKNEMESGSEKTLLERQVTVGKRVKTLLDEKRETLKSHILTQIEPLAERTRIHSLMDDSMIMNAAFLIRNGDAPKLEQMVRSLDRQYEDGLTFRMIGPLPPFSFRTFVVKTADFDRLNSARKLLELKEDATQMEIREHYWRLTKKFHPDKFPGDKANQKRFEEINQAYKLVNDYCRDAACSFREKDVKGWVSLLPSED